MAFFGSYSEIFAILLAISILREGLALDLRGKDVDQSTTRHSPPNGPPEKAIDGDAYTACHTALGSQQWWSIDLGALYCLEKITIINRDNVYATRLRGAKVRAGLSPTYSDNTEIGEVTQAQAATPGGELQFGVNPPVIARYVTVDLQRDDYLHFAEIMIDEVMNPSNSQGVLDLTLVANPALLGSTGDDNAFIAAYKGPNDIAAGVSFGRQLTTGGNNTDLLPGSVEAGCPVWVLYRFQESGGIDRTGVFYTEATEGARTTRIQAVILPNEAFTPSIRPLQRTKTVSIGDSVTIEMQDVSSSSNTNYRWRHDANSDITSWNGQLSITIASVTLANGGIYSCFIEGQENQQQHGFMRLIVRACRAEMWDPPSCQNACRGCYNGGICDDKTGTCICPPGFSGDSCELFHGRDVFGQSGSHNCSETDDPHNSACRGRLFCLPDPYGCSCAAGYTGLDCTQECPDGKYGADCKHTCHCALGVTCLKDTGECSGACDAQYSGGNCQCSAQNALLGLRVTANSPYQLTVTWLRDPCISRYTLQYALTNRGQCGEIPSSQRVNVPLSDVTMTTFTVLVSHSTYSVYITPHYGTIQGPESAVSTTTLRRNNPTSVVPVETAVDATSITPSWQEVFCAVYKVEYRLLNWDYCQSFIPPLNYTRHCTCSGVMTVISSLLPYSQYQVQVQAYVDGSYGPLEMLNVNTNQAAPTGPPDEIKATSIQKRKLTFSWSEPLCGTRGGFITGYNYKLSTVASPVQVIIESTTTQKFDLISDLMPYTEYKFEVSAVTSVGAGPFGEANVTRTSEAEPTVPLNVAVLDVDDESITLTWAEPNPPQGIITHYNVRYDVVQPTDSSTVVPNVTPLMHRIRNLQPNITYYLQVQAATIVGVGPWSDPANTTTRIGAPTGPPDEIKATSIQKRRLTFSWSEPLFGTRGGLIIGYNYRLSTVASPVQVVKESTTTQQSVLISDLMPYTEYKFEVSAVTSVGAGPFGEADVTRTLEAEPTVPLNIKVLNVDEESVTLTWDEPNPPQGIITHYNIRYDMSQSTDNSTVIPDVTALTHRIENLQAHIAYFIRVQAVTVVGPGPWSDPVPEITRIGVPGNVRRLHATSVTDRLISLEWEAPINPNGQITGYTIEYRIREKAYEVNFEVGNMFLKMEVIMPRYQGEAFEPGTKYEFEVWAKNQLNTGLASVVEVYTKPLNERDIPQPTALKVFSEETTDSTVTIGLTEVDSKYIVSYNIKMERELSETKREAFIPKHYRDSANDYIAAEIPKADMSQRFVVGDSKMHGGYYNAPLQMGSTYRIRVGALSLGNASEATVKYSEPVVVTVQKPSGISVGLVVGVVVGPIVILVVAVVGYVLCRKRNARKPTTCNSESTAEGIEMATKQLARVQDIESPHCSAINPDDIVYEGLGSGLPAWAVKLEIKWEDLKIKDTVLGKGNFGEVRAGKVKVKGRVVRAAVKTLKAGAVTSAKDDFMVEFQTMTKIKKHLNVVCLLGACLHQDILHVALEFLPNGNLRDYLRKTRPSQDTEQAPGHDAQTSPLTSSNLLTFGIDVARGMEHLSNTGIIHRDLAARNILLAEDLTAKVSDFGLSRGEDIYVQKSSTRIPVRWLAIESLVNREYESKSDVWSFGILLWEIATFASTPYPGIDSKSLAQKLLDGYRMPKPENCADKMYDLMMRCWQEQRNDRPSFNELTAALERMNDPADESTYMAPRIYINCIIKPEFDDN